MKKYIIYILLFLFSFSFVSTSQTVDTVNRINIPPRFQKFSFQFAVGNNLTLQSFDGLMLTLKYHFTDRYAFRFGIGILGSSNNEISSYYGGTVQTPNNSENILFLSSFLIYPKPKDDFIFFWGVGPRFSFSHKLKNKYDEITSWAAGLQLNLGAEWFATKEFSLFGEYNAYGTYGKTHSQEFRCSGGSCGLVKTTSTDWYFNGTTARLGISVYF